MKVNDKKLQSSKKAATVSPQETPKKAPASKKDWVRLSDERRFGAISGAGIRLWGDE